MFSADLRDVPTKEFECRILDSDGGVIFEQSNVVAPKRWTHQGVTIFADKYFRGNIGDTNRETSILDVIDRVANTVWHWGRDGGYFLSDDDAHDFGSDLKWILVNQWASFNSPVWFNFGVPNERHQGSACFILEVEDDMRSITQRAVDESLLFQNGSGSGANNSRLRGSMEPLSRGGYASGPVSFMRGWDAFAGIIKSGGKTRRAAKMEILDVDHPDIMEFIYCKVLQERKAKALKAAGFGSGNINEMEEVFHQNANHSVRISYDFMIAVQNDKDWNLIARNNRGDHEVPTYTMGSANSYGIRMIDGGVGEIIQVVKAREIWDAIVECAHECGDPGVFFDDNINKWNTVPDVGQIESSNPCGEFLHPNNTACNLASINLAKFIWYDPDDKEIRFDDEKYETTVRVMITAMEIIAGRAEYPTKKIEDNSKRLRPLGLGYTGVGHMLMSIGVPYESIKARDLLARLTCFTTGIAYHHSAWMMSKCDFPEQLNRKNMLGVMSKHQAEINKIQVSGRTWEHMLPLESLQQLWDDVLRQGEESGFRNSQVTLMAPTGTISFGMDMGHSTGIEPIFMFLAMKKMAGAGTIILDTSEAVQKGLEALELGPYDLDDLMEGNLAETLLDELKASHVFDTASDDNPIGCAISPIGHVQMMAAIQPFLSGGISKTVNLPNSATHENISDTYMMAWQSGLKAVALYRDGSKFEQPYSSSDEDTVPEIVTEDVIEIKTTAEPVRKAPPDKRTGSTYKAKIGGQTFYIITNVYPDTNELCEVFVTAAKEGSTVSGLVDTVAILLSFCIQYGLPMDALIRKFKDTRFEPNGVTNHPDIPIALSPIDFLVRYLDLEFYQDDEEEFEPDDDDDDDYLTIGGEYSGHTCGECGGMTMRTGKCHTCTNCGVTSGCG